MGWFTKTVEVEKVVERVVLGAPVAVSIYEARTEKERYYVGCSYIHKEHHGYYLSCADAFKAWPGAKVVEHKGICVGGEYFVFPEGIEPIKVTKPKRDKGKAKA